MNYRLRDLPRMLATAGGRLQVSHGILFRLFPLLSWLASIYRRTVVRRTRTVVVVGSFGKSTTARATTVALGMTPHPHITANAFTSVVWAVLRIKPSQTHAVVEVGINAPGQMVPYARLTRPDVVVVTSIGSEGATQLGTLEEIAAEKSLMLKALDVSGTAVVNGDDPHVMWMAEQTQARVITYGFGSHCDVRASDLRLDWPDGSRFHLEAFGEQRDVAIQLLGRHMIYPALAAVAVSRLEGFELDQTLSSLSTLPPTPGRMESVILKDGVALLRDDHKSTLETMHAALDVFAEVPAKRRIVLFGDLTEPPADAAPVYEALGARIAEAAAHLIVVGHGLEDYSAGALRAGMPASNIHDGGKTPQQATMVLRRLLQPGDVVLTKGRKGQALSRVQLLLQGERVHCELSLCGIPTTCVQCPMLADGWKGRPYVLPRGVVEDYRTNSACSDRTGIAP
jgi:UDP-N-acetylmuramoyl-tripeptide--D-alanyl-D-alanine ligase